MDEKNNALSVETIKQQLSDRNLAKVAKLCGLTHATVSKLAKHPEKCSKSSCVMISHYIIKTQLPQDIMR